MMNQTSDPRPASLPPPRPPSRRVVMPRPAPGVSGNASFLLRFVLASLAAVAAVAMIASAPVTVLAPILTVLGAGALTSAFIVLADRWLARRRRPHGAHPWSAARKPRSRRRSREHRGVAAHVPTRYFRSIPFSPGAR